MKILITGAKGFIGKNFIAELNATTDHELLLCDKETDVSLLEFYCAEADFIFHLAGVNRPKNEEDFLTGNVGFTSTLLTMLKKYHNTCPVMISSSIQASLGNPYGLSKKYGEDLLKDYNKETGAKILIYRFQNIFGKWCRPNYNSAIATFCYNIARNSPITVNNPDVIMNLIYIDDVVKELMGALEGKENRLEEICAVSDVYNVRLGDIVSLLESFKASRTELTIPNMGDAFTKKLYSTYLSYLPEDKFSYPLIMNVDNRGSFTEFIKTSDRGQVSVNISKPGIIKGNHWHRTKNEKFLVVNGTGVIRFRKIDSDEVIQYIVSGEKMEVVDIPVGYTHNIENLGNTDMVTIMWANEMFNSESPDTFFDEVSIENSQQKLEISDGSIAR